MGEINFIDIENELTQAVRTSLFDKNTKSDSNIQPKLIFNTNTETQKMNMLDALRSEINRCDEFWFSVAFVKKSGLVDIKLNLQEAAKKGVKGRILTTTYLGFNDPESFRDLLSLENVEVRVLDKPCHTKGYRFYHKNHGNLIIGSSNLTMSALISNEEWNIRLSSLESGAVLDEVDAQFENLWNEAKILTPQWIDEYEKYTYREMQRVKKEAKVIPLEMATLTPNAMQEEAMASLDALRQKGEKKALLISATGTGKTYLSAFDVRAYKPKRMLFIAHREQLLTQAKKSYERVLADTVTYGILSGNAKESDADFVFSTVQTLSKDVTQFEKDAFDYIVIDEVHRAGAPTYQKILDYFTPKFLLGMTATPERGDNIDIYALFDHNIAYEIRLQKALEMNLLCPFKYFGLEDISIDGRLIEDNAAFNMLVSDERVRQVLKNAEYYGHSGKRVKGLIFCNEVKVAQELSEKFKAYGYKTQALSGADSQETRNRAIEKLQSDDEEDFLHYIFTVDIFNEGVDIPEVNQVIMLRPTESAIVFVQQLGRGLRKAKNKEYVTILDFIGNYNTSYLIPIALSGDRSYNKDNIRRFILEDSKFLPGLSTVNFSRVTKERLFKNIDNSVFSTLKLLKEAYFELKKKVGHIPTLEDFEKFGSMDIQNFIAYSKSYSAFLAKVDKDFTEKFTPTQEKIMEFVSLFLSKGKRKEELLVLKALLTKDSYRLKVEERVAQSVKKVLSNGFQTNAIATKQYALAQLVDEKGAANEFIRTKTFAEALESESFTVMLEDLIAYGLRQYEDKFTQQYKDSAFVLNEKYTYADVCKLLLWDTNVTALNIGGYMYDENTNTMPVFINYHKAEDIKDSINYEDRFINASHLIAISKSGRDLNSKDIVRLMDYENNGMKIYLFVRKNKDDKGSKEFYFLGEMKPMDQYELIHHTNKHTAVEISYALETPVRSDLYEYITSSEE